MKKRVILRKRIKPVNLNNLSGELEGVVKPGNKYTRRAWRMCLGCGELFEVFPHKYQSRSFCSRECYRNNEKVTYIAIHMRLRDRYGKASEYECSNCWRQAKDWALLPGEGTHVGKQGKKTLAYSVNLDSYTPLCRRCHIEMDRGMAA